MKLSKKTVTGAIAIIGVLAVVAVLWMVKNAGRKETVSSSVEPESLATAEPLLGESDIEGASPEPKPAASVSSALAGKTVAPSPSPVKEVPSLAKGPLQLIAPFDLDALRRTGLPLIIDFGADSCIPCKEMAPVLVELHKSLEGKAIIRFVDVWKYRDLADGIPLQVIPTQVFFDAQGKPFSPDMSTLQVPFTQYKTRDTDEHVFTTHEGGLDKAQMLAILVAMGMKK